ncbi:hypothetical protein [Alkaliphilus crotonatoxidans]
MFLGLDWYWWLLLIALLLISIPFKFRFIKWWEKRRQSSNQKDKWGDDV